MNIRTYEPAYRPFKLLNRLHEDLDRLYKLGPNDERDNVADWLPPVDIRESDDAYVFRADLPGIDPENIEITMQQGSLTLSGKRDAETSETQDNYHRIERVSGRFYRRFNLPDTANSEAISATNRNGVLEITVPKQKQAEAKRIEITKA